MSMIELFIGFIFLYIIVFIALVLRGWNRDFIVPVAFSYARNMLLNRILAYIFSPLYIVGRFMFGLRLLNPVLRSLR
ncbi:hypothetical protein SCALIN_C03_0101 [Candidatus Scalindua japonica]|uniref:Uncharacterized protein n=1 Tax=Candidatus Scalindua japonica TaxID=1284222 RepID=A0A286TUB2_9BACT|nr:hypothetical protein SCALIN_C03_0101 [Candidatus Scalindua japonica]